MEDNLISTLNNIKSNIICFICKDVVIKALKYQQCQHFFCGSCVSKIATKELCPQCGLCSGTSVVLDVIVNRFAKAWYRMCKNLGIEKDKIEQIDKRSKALETSIVHDERTKISKRNLKRRGQNTSKENMQKKKKMLDISISKADATARNYETSYDKQDTANTILPNETSTVVDHRKKHVINTKEEKIIKKLPRKKSEFFINTFYGFENSKIGKENIHKASTSNVKPSNNTVSDKLNTSTVINDKNIHKRNNKGETPLHIACLKGNVEKLKMLLDLGAKTNTKDNAGWTPLQEAADKGYEEIVKILLDNGTIPDMPGFENSTPLHMAVNNNHISIARMLLEYGCNKEARNIYNDTPESLCNSTEMKNILEKTSVNAPLVSLSQNIVLPNDTSKIVMYSPDLPKEKLERLAVIINTTETHITRSYKMDRNITHILVNTDNDLHCKLSIPVLLGLLSGKWIISDQWIYSYSSSESTEMEKFEITGTECSPLSAAGKRSRISHTNQLPGLFNGCHFYFLGPPTDAKLGNLTISRYHLTLFVEYGGGILLKREPNPELIPESEKTSPYHVKSTSALRKCSHYIIYRKDLQEPTLKYNMPHIKSLPLEWMVDCIENYKLMEPYDYFL